ncbi:MAG: M1 family metallopeptidase [Kofleriaceae bacterium]
MQRLLVVALTCTCACSGQDLAPPEPAPTVVVAVAPKDARPATSPTLPVPGVHLPDGATPRSYDLRLELDADRETFSGTVAIHVTLDRASDRVWLHADELVIQDAHWDDGPLEVVTGPDRTIAVVFGEPLAPRDVTLTLAFTGTTRHDEEGLFRQQDGEHWYLYSQGESEFARRITPCFDEPRWKTPWRVTVVAPKDQVVAGNMPIAHETLTNDGRREVVLAETPPLPTYLLAVAVGPFAVIDAGRIGKARLPLRVLTFPRRVKAAASVARQTGRLVALLEDYTGIPLPFPKLDIVTVPHLFGAMENPGLITFDADIVFDGDRRYAVIAAHELAHQWFGNLVTPVWWDDLWLSEAFASWLGEKVAAKNEGHLPSELHVAFTRENALAADADTGAQALHRPITFDPDNAFDSIEYDKGEAVLAMFEAWLGEDVFRAALRTYLRDHAGGSVTTADLVKAFAATPEAAQALQAYVDHAGPPIVELALTCEGTPALRAHARDGLQIPVCVRIDKVKTCALVGDATELPITTCPTSVLATGGGYYNVVWTTHGPRGPLPAWSHLTAGDKIALATDLGAATARGDLTPAVALAELTDLAANKDPYAQYAAVAIAQALDPLVADAARETWSTWLAARLSVGDAHGILGDKLRGALLDMIAPAQLPAALRKRARAAVAASLAKHTAPWDASAVLAAEPDHAAFEQLAKLAHDPKGDLDQRAAAMVDLSAFGPSEIPNAVAELATLLPAHDAWSAVGPYFDRAATRNAAWAAVRDRAPELFAKMTSPQARDLIDATGALCDPTSRAEVRATIEPLIARIREGQPRFDHALASIDRCIARRAKAGDFAAALPARN